MTQRAGGRIAGTAALPMRQGCVADICDLQLAQQNISRHGLDGRINLIQSDLYNALATELRPQVTNSLYADCEMGISYRKNI
ncbi:MAG: hypothetical protein ACNYPG_02975 [Candidatus Porifericomitaceae bacterium WSBS_2022_MAG_OTU9]